MLPSWSRRLVTSGIGYRSFRVILLRLRKSTQSRRVPSFFFAKRTGAPPGDCDDWMNPLPSMSSRNSRKLCARERVDVAMRRCLVILDVNFMVKLAMRRHVLSLFSREYIEKVPICLRDDFGK